MDELEKVLLEAAQGQGPMTRMTNGGLYAIALGLLAVAKQLDKVAEAQKKK